MLLKLKKLRGVYNTMYNLARGLSIRVVSVLKALKLHTPPGLSISKNLNKLDPTNVDEDTMHQERVEQMLHYLSTPDGQRWG